MASFSTMNFPICYPPATTDPSGSIRSTADTPPYAIALIVASIAAPASMQPAFPVSFAIARLYGYPTEGSTLTRCNPRQPPTDLKRDI